MRRTSIPDAGDRTIITCTRHGECVIEIMRVYSYESNLIVRALSIAPSKSLLEDTSNRPANRT